MATADRATIVRRGWARPVAVLCVLLIWTGCGTIHKVDRSGDSQDGGAAEGADRDKSTNGDTDDKKGDKGKNADDAPAARGDSSTADTDSKDGAAPDPPDPNRVKPGTICDRLATIQCEGEQRCCDDPGEDFASCHEAIKDVCETDLLTDVIAAMPIAGFDADRAEAALDEIERLAGKCDPTIASLGESPDGLRGIFAGTLKEGADCTPRKLGDDASAGASLAACKDPEDIACLPKGLSWSCVARVDVGGDCFSDANCYLGLFCDNPDLRISGSACMERRIPGTACVTPNECTSLACNDGKCAEPGVQTAYCLL